MQELQAIKFPPYIEDGMTSGWAHDMNIPCPISIQEGEEESDGNDQRWRP
jgi:hypothetical protein